MSNPSNIKSNLFKYYYSIKNTFIIYPNYKNLNIYQNITLKIWRLMKLIK